MKKMINILTQLNGFELRGSATQLDWTNSAGEKYIHFEALHPTPACFISQTQVSAQELKEEFKKDWRNIQSDEYRNKSIYSRMKDWVFIHPFIYKGLV